MNFPLPQLAKQKNKSAIFLFNHTFRIELLILITFSITTALVTYRHEPWRDELHTWIIVQQSNSLAELLRNKAYEGHLDLWYIIMYGLKLVSTNFRLVQFVNWLFGIISVAILVFRSPFSLWLKTAISFSYFIIFEYTALSRPYALGLMLLFGICAIFKYKNRATYYFYICILITLLLQTSIMAALIGCSIYGVLLLELVLYRKNYLINNAFRYIIGSSIILAGFILCFLRIKPPTDYGFTSFTHHERTAENVIWCLSAIYNALVPIPSNLLFFWNTNFIDSFGERSVTYLLKACLAVVLLLFMIRPLFLSKLALAGWCASILLILYILFEKYFGSLRHHGHFFISLLSFLWIQSYLLDYGRGSKSTTRSGSDSVSLLHKLCLNILPINRSRPLPMYLWSCILIAQLVAGFIAICVDLKYTFSNSGYVAKFINDSPYKTWHIAGDSDTALESIASYLPNSTVYYPGSGQQGGFIKWTYRRRNLTLPQIVDSGRQHTKPNTLLIINHPSSKSETDSLGLRLVRSFEYAIVYDEEYWIYELEKPVATSH